MKKVFNPFTSNLDFTYDQASEINTETDWVFLSGQDDTAQKALDEIDTTLNKLAPAKPAYLSAVTMSLSSYQADRSDVPTTTEDRCTDVLRPVGTCSNFFDGDNGVLTARVDTVDRGNRTLTTSSDVGTYGYLGITADVDPYLGQAGKEGFWKQLTANITPTADLSIGAHSYSMEHSITGNSQINNFYVDDPVTPSISNKSSVYNSGTTKKVSGVPTLDTGNTIRIQFRVSNAVKTHYHRTQVASITSTGSVTNSPSIAPSSTPYSNGANIDVDTTVTVASSRYTEGAAWTFYGYNSKGTSGSSSQTSTIRVDTVSNELSGSAMRKTSGSGQYPSSGYGSTYDSTADLKTTNTEELQMLNGLYRWPTGNYTSNLPTAGPDYSSGMGSGTRWVTFNPGSVSNISAVTIAFSSASNFGSNAIVSGLSLYVKVEGATGWVDGNAAYPGVGNPVNDGDPAEVVGSSTATSHRVTFGSVTRSGQLYVRVGLPASSTKTFAYITAT
jgi:hypothetical protein